jgi:hypothetical protein
MTQRNANVDSDQLIPVSAIWFNPNQKHFSALC